MHLKLSQNDNTIRSLAKYVFEAFHVRNLSVSCYVLCVVPLLRKGGSRRDCSLVAGCIYFVIYVNKMKLG